ncbi:MAG: serine/threonine protein kinase [Pirellulales bacterium]|nr:serine/threonine protein kinase [Pirellulales bacterium]
MSDSTRSEFEQCALASQLLSQEQLDEVTAVIVRENGGKDVDGRSLAGRLVEFGYLNAWQAKQLLEGQTRFHLGPYRIVDWLGQGGMGQVFRAEHHLLGRQVAIKVLPRDRCTPEAVRNFTREIRAQASLDHRNLVKALDAGHDGNVYYLVSEYVPGTDLRKLVHKTGPLSMETAASIITQVAEALEHAHQRGLIHRDVKPGNVLVTPDGQAKLSDLGLAGPLGGDPKSDPRFGKIVGTADYLSPDQIKAPWAPNPAWDVYSLGCTLYYAVTSKVPYPGGSTADKARAHCELQPLDPRRFNPTLDEDFVDALADMVMKDPDERLQTAAEVIEHLAPWAVEPRPVAELERLGPVGETNHSTALRPSNGSGSGSPMPDPDETKDSLSDLRSVLRSPRSADAARSDPTPPSSPAPENVPAEATSANVSNTEAEPPDASQTLDRNLRPIMLAIGLVGGAAVVLWVMTLFW